MTQNIVAVTSEHCKSAAAWPIGVAVLGRSINLVGRRVQRTSIPAEVERVGNERTKEESKETRGAGLGEEGGEFQPGERSLKATYASLSEGPWNSKERGGPFITYPQPMLDPHVSSPHLAGNRSVSLAKQTSSFNATIIYGCCTSIFPHIFGSSTPMACLDSSANLTNICPGVLHR